MSINYVVICLLRHRGHKNQITFLGKIVCAVCWRYLGSFCFISSITLLFKEIYEMKRGLRSGEEARFKKFISRIFFLITCSDFS